VRLAGADPFFFTQNPGGPMDSTASAADNPAAASIDDPLAGNVRH